MRLQVSGVNVPVEATTPRVLLTLQSFTSVEEEIQDMVATANLTPTKCLGFRAPIQAILKELGKDAQIRFS